MAAKKKTRKKVRAKRPRAKKPARETAEERALRSGFPQKLRSWLEDNMDDRKSGRTVHGPSSGAQLAAMLTHHGEHTIPNTVERWMRGEALPLAKHIPHIEGWMGVPWAYLDDPTTKWPVNRDAQYWHHLIQTLSPSELGRLLAELEGIRDAKAAGRRRRQA